MKNKFLACTTAMGMFLTAMPVGSIAAYAEDTEALPSWIPTGLEETIDFYNQYGATHIEDGLICIVFEESLNEIYSYEAVSTDDSCKLSREVYENNNSASKYEVVVYRPNSSGEFNVELNWTYKDTVRKDSSYAFLADDSGEITETDIYAWVPDCITEYNDFQSKYGEASIHENYIVYCGDINYSCGHSLVMEQNGTARIEQIAVSSCGEKTIEVAPPGTTSHNVYIYQAVSDGTVDISWKIGQEWNLDNSIDSNVEKKYEVKNNVITDITDNDIEQEFEIIDSSIYFDKEFILGFEQEQLFDIEHDNDKIIFTPKSDGNYYAMTVNCIEETRSLEDGSHLHYSYDTLTNYTITVKDGIPTVEKKGQPSYYSNYDIQEYLKNPNNDYTPCKEKGCCGELYSRIRENSILSYLNGQIASDKYFISLNTKNGSINALIMNHIDEEAVAVDKSRLNVNTINSSSSTNADFQLATPDWFPNVSIAARLSLWEPAVENGAALFTVKDENSWICYAIDVVDENIVPSTLRIVDQAVKGDLNGDGELTIADIVILQNWLINASDTELINWKAADLCEDSIIDIYDLCMMRQELLKL